MSNGEIKISSISDFIRNLRENNIYVNEEDVVSFFLETIGENESLDVETFTSLIAENYGIENTEELELFSQNISGIDGVKGSFSQTDIESLILRETLITNDYSGEDWEDISPKENSGFFGGKTFVYTTSNGSKVSVTDTENVIVKQNKATGELVIIGGRDVNVDAAKNASITLVESNADTINAENGGETITVRGSHSNVEKIKGSDGNQTIRITDGASIEKIDTGSGDDTVTVENGSVVGKLNTGTGDDSVTIQNATVNNSLKTNQGNDTVKIINSEINGEIITNNGDDTIIIQNSTINQDIETGSGTNTVEIDNSHLSSSADIITGKNSNSVTIKNSEVEGEIRGSVSYTDISLNIANSRVKEVNGIINGNNTNINITDSAVGMSSQLSADREVKPLDTSSGKYKGYLSVSCEIQNIDGEYYYVYTLDNGSIIRANDSKGEVYFNPETGDIVLNSVNSGEIHLDESANNLTVLNSTVKSIYGLKNNFTAENSIIDYLQVTDSELKSQINLDRCTLQTLSAINSSIDINASNGTKIGKINSIGDAEYVTVNLNDGKIDNITTKGNIAVKLSNSSDKDIIGNIRTEKGTISGSINGIHITSIKTKEGSINLTAKNSEIGTITNNSSSGNTKLDLQNVVLTKITSDAKAQIKLSGCTLKEIVTNNDGDEVSVKDSKVKQVVINGEGGTLVLDNDKLGRVISSGTTAVSNSQAKEIYSEGDIALQTSTVEMMGDMTIGSENNISSENSVINENKTESEKTSGNENKALEILNTLNSEETDLLYTMLIKLMPEEAAKFDSTLSKDEIIRALFNSDNTIIETLRNQIILDMKSALDSQKERIDNNNSTIGKFGRENKNEQIEYETKLKLFNEAIDSGDYRKLFDTYSLITGEKANVSGLSDVIQSVEYAQNLSDEEISDILSALYFIGNALEYTAFSQDGIIKSGIAAINNDLDIGTTKNEVMAYLTTFRSNIESLRNRLQSGELKPEEFASEYKKLTGDPLTRENVNTLLDNVRGNDKFDSNIQDVIEDYQNTQQKIFSVGEYVVIIGSGMCVTVATGGAAGPAVAAALRSLGQMGIALSATTVSFLTKTAIELTERSSNSTVADDVTPEEIGKSAAMMYAGCIAGQFGNAMGAFVGNKLEDSAYKFILSKLADVSSDSALSLGFDYAIIGNGEFSQEFIENLKQEFIGVLQSKITNAYLSSHGIQFAVDDIRYKTQKAYPNLSPEEINLKVLIQSGMSAEDAASNKGLSTKEVDTLAMSAYAQRLSADALNSRQLDTSHLSQDEVLNKGKIVSDLFNSAQIKQTTDGSCAVVSVLNAIENKPVLIQALLNKFEYNFDTDTYKFNAFGEEFEFKLENGENPLQKVYDAYQLTYGKDIQGDFATRVFDEILSGANDITVKPDSTNIQTLKRYSEDDSSILTFNTTESIKGLEAGHSYNVLSIDDMGNMKLQDPLTLEEITVMRSDYENKNCQVVGKTYADLGVTEGVTPRMVAGVGQNEQTNTTENQKPLTISDIEDMINQQLTRMGLENDYTEDKITEVARIIEKAKKRLDNAGKRISEIDLFDYVIARHSMQDASSLLTVMSNMTALNDETAGRGIIISKLINSGILNEDILKTVTGEDMYAWAFDSAYSKNNANGKDYFASILISCGYNSSEVKFLTELAKEISLGQISISDINNLGIDIVHPNQDSSVFKLINRGLNFGDIFKYKDKFDYDLIASEIDESYEIYFVDQQQTNKIDIIANKTQNNNGSSSNDTQNSDDIKVMQTITFTEDGQVIKGKIIKNANGDCESWYFNSDKTIILNTKEVECYGIEYNTDVPISQIEIINDSNGEPSYIISTKSSTKLPGAFETTRYNLSDYPEDYDVLSAIKNGTIEGGEPLSTVKSENGTTTYAESYVRNGSTVNKNFAQQVDDAGEIKSTEYTYRIEDTNGKTLFDITRSWTQNNDGTTTTIINGQKYTTGFNDTTHEIVISSTDGKEIKINFNELIKDNNAEIEKIWNFIKKQPADLIITMKKNVSELIYISDSLGSSYTFEAEKLVTGNNQGILAHELGHSIDQNSRTNGELITSNTELKEIYNREFETFRLEYPTLAQNVVDYFSQNGGSGGSGLSELVAETNALITTFGHSNPQVMLRAEYLTRYFPNTVAKAAELLMEAKNTVIEETSGFENTMEDAAIIPRKTEAIDPQGSRVSGIISPQVQSEIDTIASKILRYASSIDVEDEIDISSIKDMLTALQGSKQNLNTDGIETAEKLLYGLFESAAEGDYVNFKAITTAIKHIAEMTDISSDISYKLESLFSHSEYGGICSVEDTELVEKFFTTTKNMLEGTESKKIFEILETLDKVVGNSDEAEENLSKLVEEFESISKTYPKEQQSEVLYERFVNNVPMNKIELKLKTNQNSMQLYNALAQKGINISQEALTSRLGETINILLSRNYSIDEIAEKLSTQGAIVQLLTNVKAVNPEIMADFIENNMETFVLDYDIFHEYTSSHWKFSDYTTDKEGNIIPGEEYSVGEAERLHSALIDIKTPKDMTVYRGEGFSVLDSYTLPDGTRLSDAIREVMTTGNEDLKETIKSFLSDTTITQPRFMSTAYTKEGAEHFIKGESGILWEIDAPKGSHGLYVDPFNSKNSNEAEILFDRNTNLIIYDIEFKDNIIYLKAKLE